MCARRISCSEGSLSVADGWFRYGDGFRRGGCRGRWQQPGRWPAARAKRSPSARALSRARRRKARSATMVSSSMATRRDWWVLVSFSRSSRPTWEIDRRIVISARSRPMSVQRTAHPSPRRHAVAASSHRYTANAGSSALAPSTSSCTCETVGGITSRRCWGGAVASSTGFREIRPHLRACSSDWRMTVWQIRTVRVDRPRRCISA